MATKIGCVNVILDGEHIVGLQCAKGRGIILPGGKQEPGESWVETARRELKEETNLTGIKFEHFHSNMSPSDNFYVHAFLTEVLAIEYGFKSREGTVVKATWDDLLVSQFREYYIQMRKDLNANRKI